jgi:light-regulated signal transduction histidine kinase (bacteriophytochrome)
LLKERIIAADDAHTNEYTYEFSDVYLKPLGISSMLDAPIWLGGNAIGVLCCEHVGEKRKWGIDEENFAASVADFASISFELAEHKKTSDELREHKNKLESIVNERTAELREKNDALEAFNYSVSHDLRAPLRHAAGYLQIIEEDYSDRIDDTGLDYIKRARDSLGKMNLMIDSMLNLSRITTHKMKKTEIDLSKLMKVIAGQLVERDHPVDLRINNTPKAVGDAGLLQIALTNLLENALKYTQKVPDPVIEFGSLQIKDKTVYFLKDNGCGFDARYVDKLFAVFQRLHSESEFEGAGIGLSTVQRVIQNHGGEIRAEGEVGKGASFYFSLGDK